MFEPPLIPLLLWTAGFEHWFEVAICAATGVVVLYRLRTDGQGGRAAARKPETYDLGLIYLNISLGGTIQALPDWAGALVEQAGGPRAVGPAGTFRVLTDISTYQPLIFCLAWLLAYWFVVSQTEVFRNTPFPDAKGVVGNKIRKMFWLVFLNGCGFSMVALYFSWMR